MKYKVRIEIEVASCDLATYEVEADSPERAKLLAIDNFNNGVEPIDRWSSSYIDSSIDKQYIDDWEVIQID